MALRKGFTRYAVSIQYHGSSFLGFSLQRDQEDSILPDGTDLRGYRSVEGRLREALTSLLNSRTRYQQDSDYSEDSFDEAEISPPPPKNTLFAENQSECRFENIQVSSRTDRGVHALHNTLHVDIQNPDKPWKSVSLHRGLNHHLSRQSLSHGIPPSQRVKTSQHHLPRGDDDFPRWSPMNEIRVLKVRKAPLYMINPFAENDPSQDAEIDWNARFSATERTYIYRILHSPLCERDWAAPFEWDRAWRINDPLDLTAMQEAASYMQGTHDFSSFRTAGCQRRNPIVTMHDISLITQPYGPPLGRWGSGCDKGLLNMLDIPSDSLLLTTILVKGNSFVYRQVRNMVGCLVAVGRGQIRPDAIPNLIASRDRRKTPSMAPAHGLFLARVQHGDLDI